MPQDISLSNILYTFYLGGKFDLRLASLLLIPFLILFKIRILKFQIPRTFWIYFYTFVSSLWILLYFIDFGYFSYLKFRINPGTLHLLLNDTWTSLKVIQSHYSVLSLTVLYSLLILFHYFIFKKFIFKEKFFLKQKRLNKQSKIWTRRFYYACFLFFFLASLYGKLAYYPLRWSEAFFHPNTFISSLGLNPILYFRYMLRYRTYDSYNEKDFEPYRSLMQSYFGVEKPTPFDLPFARENYMRPYNTNDNKVHKKNAGTKTKNKKHPNIILIVMESLANFKTSLMHPEIKSTPYLYKLAKESIWFKNYYVPVVGTARSIFCIMTQIPDITPIETASRNPLMVKQNVAMNAFKGYDKFYFIGGSANWANIRAVFTSNVKDIKVFEEGDYDSPRMDVWGISDYDLLQEAHKRFLKQKNPFFSVIQLSSFHSPYTLPLNLHLFKPIMLDKKDLKMRDFSSSQQFNSLRFSDYALGKFMENVKKSHYYKNTLFIITGDHGVAEHSSAYVEEYYSNLNLGFYHLPLIFHAHPQWIEKPYVDERIAMASDVMPSITSFARIPYTNTSFGHSLFDPNDKNRYAFLFTIGARDQFLLNERYILKLQKNGRKFLYDYKGSKPHKPLDENNPEVQDKMKEFARLAEGHYEGARFLLYKKIKKENFKKNPLLSRSTLKIH